MLIGLLFILLTAAIASKKYKQHIKLNPIEANDILNAAEMYWQYGRREKAIKMLQRALSQQPDNAELQQKLAQYLQH